MKKLKEVKKLTEKETPEPKKENKVEQELQIYLEKRIKVLKDARKSIMGKFDFDQLMEDADREYVPHNLKEKPQSRVNYLQVDEVTGLRGARVVNLGSQNPDGWRSDISEPTLYVKVNTALSILMQQNPEATFKATLDKYKPTSSLAKSIWKRSWNLADSKEQMKLFIQNAAKYGWAPGRTYPRLVQRPKDVLIELDIDNPENNKYERRIITEFNDIYREALDPHRTWIDDMANMYDPWSLDDWYFEKDYSKDSFDLEFSNYSHHGEVKAGALVRDEKNISDNLNDETETREDIITIGFYEKKTKDLYSIYIPDQKIVLYNGPLPNDEGLLSYWDMQWTLRDPRTRIGIGLYEILKNDKVLYDRFDNMAMDQLVMAVYKMLFYSGPHTPGDGTIRIEPGVAKQKLPGTTIDVIDVPFEKEAWKGLEFRKQRIDENTGITPTLEGEITGKTLGEVLHAKDSALKRLNIPLANIAGAIEKEAYITLSWANQVYSLPEIKQFTTLEQLRDFMEETNTQPELTTFNPDGSATADFPRSLDLSLEENREGELIESPEERFFTVGQNLEKKAIKWKGRVTVKALSIIAPSQELERQRKLELYNLVVPIVQAISQAMSQGMYQMAVDIARPVIQILEIQDEKPENWLPKDVILMLNNPEMITELMQQQQQQMQSGTGQPMFIKPREEQGGVAPSEKKSGVESVAPRHTVSNPVRDSVESQQGGVINKLFGK